MLTRTYSPGPFDITTFDVSCTVRATDNTGHCVEAISRSVLTVIIGEKLTCTIMVKCNCYVRLVAHVHVLGEGWGYWLNIVFCGGGEGAHRCRNPSDHF